MYISYYNLLNEYSSFYCTFLETSKHINMEKVFSPVLPAMCHSVSIIQKNTDLVLEDIEQEEVKETKPEVKEEPQLEKKEDVKPSKKEVSLTWPHDCNTQLWATPV